MGVLPSQPEGLGREARVGVSRGSLTPDYAPLAPPANAPLAPPAKQRPWALLSDNVSGPETPRTTDARPSSGRTNLHRKGNVFVVRFQIQLKTTSTVIMASTKQLI